LLLGQAAFEFFSGRGVPAPARSGRCGLGVAEASHGDNRFRALTELGRTASPRLAVNAVLKQLFACTPKMAAAMACSNFAYRRKHATASW
jgi:hypothetical protein